MVTRQQEQKITYSTMGVEQAQAFNSAYEEALRALQNGLGRTHPVFIGGVERMVDAPAFESRSPSDTRVVVGAFQECGEREANDAVQAARTAWPGWGGTPWQERIVLMRRAADIFRQRKYEIAAWLTVEAGKPRLEAMGEVEEAADLISWYCDEIERHDGYVVKLNQLSPEEVNHSVLRPYGVFVVIAPFNFPVALATGMVAGALIAGNTVVFKPSSDTPMAGVHVYRCLADAGLPAGAVNFVTGSGNDIGEALSTNPGVDGVAFTGSREVGTHIYREFSKNRPRPCIAEMGGKNPVIVTEHADLAKAVEGTVRAAFGYSGQKCSAASRVYVHEAVAEEFLRRIRERTEQVTVGNPALADVFMGPVIRKAAYERFKESAEAARRDGQVLVGGAILDQGELQHGYFCAPTIVELPSTHRFFYEELFVPFVAVARVTSLDEALDLANDSEYGLTAGIFSEDPDQQQRFLDRIEAGTVYVNRQAGATTGAWPGIQSFGGWRASGSTGKNALGTYYVPQFMHEQSQTVVSD